MKKSARRVDKKPIEGKTAKRERGSASSVARTRGYAFMTVVALAFLLRLLYLLQIDSIPLFYHLAGDGRTYDEWAQRIAAGDWLGSGVFYQAPLYPYFLGVLQFVLGHDLWAIRFVQLMLGSLACGVIFLVGDKLFSRGAGLAAGLILATYAPAIFFDALIEKSILDLFLLSLLLFFLLAKLDDEGLGKWLAAGLVLALLGLSRENALVLVPVVALWIAVYFSEKPVSLRARWLGVFLAGLLLILLPVGLRNLTVGGEFKLTTSQFGPNFFIGNNAAADGTYGSVRNTIREVQLEGNDAKRLAEKAVGRELTAGEVSDYWFMRARADIQQEPAGWLRLLGQKWLLVWNAREIEDSDDFYIYQRWSGLLTLLGWINHFGVLVPLALLGVFLTCSRWRALWLLYAMILALAGSVALFYVFGRYRYPLVPLLALFAGAGLVQAVMLLRANKRMQLTQALVGALLIGVGVNWPVHGGAQPGAAGYNNLANAYLKAGKVEEATRTALKAVEVEPNYGVAHYNLGNLYAQQGNFEQARRHFLEALRLYPNYAEAHSNYGQLLAETGDLQTGTEHFRKAIELNPGLSRAHLNLGVALAKQGRQENAIAALRQALRLAPDSAPANFYLGSVYAAESRYGEAAEAFQQALSLDPGFVPAHQSLAQLLAMQGKIAEARAHHQEALRLMGRRRPAAP